MPSLMPVRSERGLKGTALTRPGKSVMPCGREGLAVGWGDSAAKLFSFVPLSVVACVLFSNLFVMRVFNHMTSAAMLDLTLDFKGVLAPLNGNL